jgi:hypothetical protein
VEVSFVHGNELSGSLRGEEFLDYLSDLLSSVELVPFTFQFLTHTTKAGNVTQP